MRPAGVPPRVYMLTFSVLMSIDGCWRASSAKSLASLKIERYPWAASTGITHVEPSLSAPARAPIPNWGSLTSQYGWELPTGFGMLAQRTLTPLRHGRKLIVKLSTGAFAAVEHEGRRSFRVGHTFRGLYRDVRKEADD